MGGGDIKPPTPPDLKVLLIKPVENE